MKTLYVQIDSSPIPEESEDIIILDCILVNNFCSSLGYELVDGLRMPDGMPYYKAFQVGNLLADFSKVNEAAYKSIIYQWEQIQCELLKRSPQPDAYYVLSMPSEYIDWLLHHENMAFREVGTKLKIANNVKLFAEDLYTEIISTVRSRLKSYIQQNQNLIDWIVFSDGSIKQSSAIFSDLKDIVAKTKFLRLHQWQDMYVVEKHRKEMLQLKEFEERRLEEEKQRCSNQEFTVNGVSFTMVYVKGGTFNMGSNLIPDEKPIHSVTLSDFHIGCFPVTQKLWKAVMGSGNNPSKNKEDNFPVENVSWKDCQVFIDRLSEITGKDFRFPNEAQCEYAARGGEKSKGFEYAGSDDIRKVAWYEDNSGRKTHEVGAKLPNELGIYDMSGNVEEWCKDWFAPYSSSNEIDPTGPDDNVAPRYMHLKGYGGSYGPGKVCRGGDYFSSSTFCRTVDRDHRSSHQTESTLGVRLALFFS